VDGVHAGLVASARSDGESGGNRRAARALAQPTRLFIGKSKTRAKVLWFERNGSHELRR